jgi:L-fuconolactonase
VEDFMPILDSQVHAYERNHPGRPWIGTLYGPPAVTGDQLVAAMDAVGVDGAILVSPFSMYRYDASYALDVFAAHPSRFRLVKPVDPTDPAIVDTIADWASTDGTVGIRIFLNASFWRDRLEARIVEGQLSSPDREPKELIQKSDRGDCTILAARELCCITA